jgi:hypothetical protein
MNKIIIFVFLSLLTFDYGCKNNNPIKPENSYNITPIMPLKVGNQWVMYVTNNDTSNPISWMDTINVKKDTTINGETWYILNFFQYFGIYDITVTNRIDGLYEFYQDSTLHFDLWFSYPSKQGYTYQHSVYSYEVLSVKDTLLVPAGQFICYHYETAFYDYWLSQNVGLIKYEEYVLSPYQRKKIMTAELFKYNLK